MLEVPQFAVLEPAGGQGGVVFHVDDEQVDEPVGHFVLKVVDYVEFWLHVAGMRKGRIDQSRGSCV